MNSVKLILLSVWVSEFCESIITISDSKWTCAAGVCEMITPLLLLSVIVSEICEISTIIVSNEDSVKWVQHKLTIITGVG